MQPTLGEKLRDLREDKQLTQAELGQCLQMTQRKISYLETDKCEPSIDDIRRICLYFNVSADYLCDLPQGLMFPTM